MSVPDLARIVFDWSKIPAREVIPGFHGRFAHSQTMTFALWEIDQGAVLPEHSHPHEQVVHLIEGDFEVTIEGQKVTGKPGTVTAIPPHARHSGLALTRCRILDVFHPVREDYMAAGQESIIGAAYRTAR
jgi:quercetin dioxygenase-like cupin family protein